MAFVDPSTLTDPTTLPPPDGDNESGRSLRSRLPASDEALALRCLMDAAERSSTGVFIYPTLWTGLVLATGTATRWPSFAWGNLLGLLIVATLRLVLHRQLPKLVRTHRTTAEHTFNGLTLLAAAYWGSLTGLCMSRAPNEPLAWLTLIVTIGLCTGGTTMFAISRRLRYPYPVTLLLPVVLAEALLPTTEHLTLLAMQAAFVVYLNRAASIVHKDYWEARAAQRLSDQRARELELASLTDGLTHIANRIYFDRRFAYEWARQCRHGGPVSLMIMDLDHFKNINDTYGHPFGDTCLIEVAQALMAACGRSTDFVARYGGEEFVILLPETDATGARIVAERMLEAVRALQPSFEGKPVHLSASIGLCTAVPYHTKERTAIIQEADRALYRAKANGRNQVAALDTSNEIPPLRRRS